jgi:peptide/nickel transport system permease protein
MSPANAALGFQWVVLWTDVALWAMAAAGVAYAVRVLRHPTLRATWGRVLRDAPAVCSALVLGLFIVVTALDSVHLRRVLPAAPGQDPARTFYDTHTDSLLDLALARPIAMRESTYSAPLAWQGLTQESLLQGGQAVRALPRLAHGGAHLQQPALQWRADVLQRALQGAAGGLAAALLVALLAAAALRAAHGGWRSALAAIVADRTRHPVRALLLTVLVIALLAGPVVALAGHYHVLGTDRTGNDVLVLSLKSIRTAFVIGLLSTLATLPFAVVLGIVAGWFRGWVDEVVQYLYTTLSSVPNVLLIAACVLMVQVALDKHPEWFDTSAERADVKVFLLCVILGATGWATLCRLVRAETLKLRELEFVQAATAFGVSPARTMARHILPNVMHLVLISTVLNFSDLILYEAVLTYVGVGVDPGTSSFGSLINGARSEMGRDPVVWWSFVAAFGFMVALVLAANLFADGVRDALDPRARALRPRLAPRLPKAGA